jgi:signal transduction histidine kinase
MNANLTVPTSSNKLEKASAENWALVTNKMRGQPAWLTTALSTLLTLLTGWLDYVTGWEVSLFVFYAIPIIIAVWWSGGRAGVFIAIVSGVVWWTANEATHPYETQMGYAWALLNREFYFCVVVFAVTAVRNKQDADAARIQMLEEHQQLERDIVRVSEHEQQRIGQDLHDGLCQQLAAIGCAARALAEDLQNQFLPAARDAAMIEESIQLAVMEGRNLAHGIFPVHVDHDGLAAAVANLARSTSRLTGVAIDFKEGAEVRLGNREASMHLYRIFQEAVANAVRHSGAKRITVFLHQLGDELELLIEDDGTGIAAGDGNPKGGMGLRTMRYRALALGARLEIKPRAGGGTAVLCRMPIQPRPHEVHVQS